MRRLSITIVLATTHDPWNPCVAMQTRCKAFLWYGCGSVAHTYVPVGTYKHKNINVMTRIL